MNRTNIGELKNKTGEKVSVSGWVDARRDHGQLVFFDLRDQSGKVQAVVQPNQAEAHETAEKIRVEWVLQVTGTVGQRPEKMINADQPNGTVELQVETITVLNEAETPAIEVSGDGYDIGEDSRLAYRYLDLRRPRLQKNLRLRHRLIKFIRDFLDREDFYEVETPILTKSTPEGARDYVVPSRLYQGKFYALPQSPQQYKQLLMVAGLEKYFQVARCFRDEDTRGDRQPEFTQMDLEMSFVTQEEVIALNEKLLIELIRAVAPEKTIQETPFPRLTYKEAMEKYGTDRPDLRRNQKDKNSLAFCWLVDFPFFEKDEPAGLNPDGSPKYTFTHNPFSRAKPEYEEQLLKKENVEEVLTTQYDVVLNGFEVAGGSIRNHQPEALRAVFEIMGYATERIDNNFGHMLRALAAGAPPHGGIAWGLDRLVAILANEPNIREVIAFPKTGEGRDLIMNAPAEIEPKQLEELALAVKVKVPKKP